MAKYEAEIVNGDQVKHVTLIGDAVLLKARIAKWRKDGKDVTCEVDG